MKIQQLVLKLSPIDLDMFHVVMDFGEDGGKQNVGAISPLIGVEPEDAIIESAGTEDRHVCGILEDLKEFNPGADAQMFIRNGDLIAYFDVGKVEVDNYNETVYLIAGEFRTGGG